MMVLAANQPIPTIKVKAQDLAVKDKKQMWLTKWTSNRNLIFCSGFVLFDMFFNRLLFVYFHQNITYKKSTIII